MKQQIDRLEAMLKDKTVSIVGIGVSNYPLVKMLAKMGIKIIARDKNSDHILGDIYSDLKQYDVEFCLGENYLENLNEDIIFKTPGIRFDLPEFIAAKQRGSLITSEMELFFELCPASIIGVSGSDGKTTTTTLIHNMLKEQGYRCWLGGNIGMPLLDKIGEIQPEDKVILELSSFQLHTMNKSPEIAVITNISPNHLDIHKSMDEYIMAKENIVKNQTVENKFVTNFDNEITYKIAQHAKAKTAFFSSQKPVPYGVYLKDNQIISNMDLKEDVILSTSDIRLPGMHNIENYMAAIAAVWGMVDVEVIRHIASTFGGVTHRIEFVRELEHVRYYNDSIASSPTRTRAGLYSFKQKVILIAGGYDKEIPFTDFGQDIIEKVKCLILIGQTADSIYKAVVAADGYADSDIKIIRCISLHEAVNQAKENATSGDIVLLSPACASFDMFKNFEERGNLFKQLVMEL